MATLIRVKTKGSKRARRCDAVCYNAKGINCKCICSGKNHGVGEDTARSNVREYSQELMKKQEVNSYEEGDVLVIEPDNPVQTRFS